MLPKSIPLEQYFPILTERALRAEILEKGVIFSFAAGDVLMNYKNYFYLIFKKKESKINIAHRIGEVVFFLIPSFIFILPNLFVPTIFPSCFSLFLVH